MSQAGQCNDLSGCWPKGLRRLLEAELGAKAHQPDLALDWVFGRGRLHPEVQHYIAYLKRMGESFLATAELFDLWSPPGSTGSKHALRLTHPHEILYIAHHLYLLESEKVPGAVVECGCAHGFSTACLSAACAALGRQLIVADSFEGLPDVHNEEEFFRKGDYASAEDEVMHHVRLCGAPQVVRTVKGWYKDSLLGWNTPIAVLWMDVDLFESARDCLQHLLPCLSAQGAIFTHEFTDFHGRPQPLDGHNVPAAIYAAFQKQGWEFRSELICRYWGIVCGAQGVGLASHQLLDLLWERLSHMDSRWRQFDELKRSSTVRSAFALKRCLMPWRS